MNVRAHVTRPPARWWLPFVYVAAGVGVAYLALKRDPECRVPLLERLRDEGTI